MQQVLTMSRNPLCDVPWDDLKVGDRVVSRTGVGGLITDLNVHPTRMDCDDEKNRVVMRFAGKVSDQPHAWLDQVTYLGRPLAS